MNEKQLILKSSIHYYCTKNYHETFMRLCTEAIRLYPNELVFKFYYAISLSLKDLFQESNREVDAIKENDDFIISSLLILINNLKKSESHKEVSKYELKLRQTRKTASINCLYNGALYLFLTKKYEKCTEYTDRILKMHPSQNKEVYILKGYLELNNISNEINFNSALKYFEVSSKTNELECLLGKFQILLRLKNYQKAEKIINQLIELYPSMIPLYLYKIELNNQINNWNQIFQLCTKLLTIDRHCIEAHLYLVLYFLIINFDKEKIISKLVDFNSSLDLRENKNGFLYYTSSKLISRLTLSDNDILNVTFGIIENASLFKPFNLDFKYELGYQLFKRNKLFEAEKFFNNIIQEDENNLDALYGVLLIGIKKNDKNALEKINSLENDFDLEQMPTDLLYLCALNCELQNKSFSQIEKYLNLVIDRHSNEIKNIPIGVTFYIKLNIERIISIVKLYLKFAPIEPIIINKFNQNSVIINSNYLKKIENYLKPVLSNCSGLSEPIYLMTKIKYLLGDFDFALNLIEQYIQKFSSTTDGLLLKAKIFVAQNKTQNASQTLETALSYNFQIRENLDYLLAKANILKQEGKIYEAIKLLKDNKQNLSKTLKNNSYFNENYKVSIELLIVEYNAILSKQDEALDLIKNLLEKYKNTIHENHILLVNAEIEETFNQIDKTIILLKKVKVSKNSNNETYSWNNDLEYFIKSREYLANIYLKYYNDKKLAVKCYEDILDVETSVESYIMLGNFYLSILQPEKSIEVYEQALKKNPKNAQLTRRVGQLYIKIHLYEKAITYYKASIKSSSFNELRFDLAYLFYQLKRYEEAIEIVHNAKEILKNLSKQFDVLEFEVKLNYLMSKIHLESDNKELAISFLKTAYSSQTKVIRRLLTENSTLISYHQNFAFRICNELADQEVLLYRNYKQSIIVLKEALTLNENNKQILLKLAQIELNLNNTEESHKYCALILKNLANDHDTLLVLSQIMFRKNEFENSLKILEQILTNDPVNFQALVNLIEASRRTGNLINLVPNYLNRAETYSKQLNLIMDFNSKFSYCKAIYLFYISSTDEALKLFIQSKNDEKFRFYSLFKIIEICINPENEVIGNESFQNLNLNSNDRNGEQETFLKLADKFLDELSRNNSENVDFLVIKSMVVFANKQKNEINSTLNELIKKENQNVDNLPLNFAISTGLIVLNQVSKAKIILKKICKTNWNYLESDYFEKSWLLLADVYIQSNKYDLAVELLKNCLTYNKSCIKAFEYLGFIREKQQSYLDAMNNYKKAWLLSNQMNIKIGYRLAFCTMKCNIFIEAIDYCECLLKIEPNLPAVKKEILDKCKLNII